MLTVFRIVLPAALIPETPRGCGKAEVGAGDAGGRKVEEGARSPLFGVFGVSFGAGLGRAPVLLRVLPTGKAGRATFGGPFDGRGGLGSAVAMAEVCWKTAQGVPLRRDKPG